MRTLTDAERDMVFGFDDRKEMEEFLRARLTVMAEEMPGVEFNVVYRIKERWILTFFIVWLYTRIEIESWEAVDSWRWSCIEQEVRKLLKLSEPGSYRIKINGDDVRTIPGVRPPLIFTQPVLIGTPSLIYDSDEFSPGQATFKRIDYHLKGIELVDGEPVFKYA